MSDTEFNALPRRRRALKSAARGGEITQELYDSYLSTEEAADYLGLAPNTLAKARVHGTGCVFYRFGRAVRYRREDLDAWMAERSARSTSEYATSKSPEAA